MKQRKKGKKKKKREEKKIKERFTELREHESRSSHTRAQAYTHTQHARTMWGRQTCPSKNQQGIIIHHNLTLSHRVCCPCNHVATKRQGRGRWRLEVQ